MIIKQLFNKINQPRAGTMLTMISGFLVLLLTLVHTNIHAQASCVGTLTVTPTAAIAGSNGGGFTIVPADINSSSTGIIVGISFTSLDPNPVMSLSDDCNNHPTGEALVFLTTLDGTTLTECSTMVDLVDIHPPVIECFASPTVYFDNAGSVTITTDLVGEVYENCNFAFFEFVGGDPTFDCTYGPSQVLTLTAEDNFGNAATPVTCTVSLVDTIAPVANCMGALNVYTSNLNLTTAEVDNMSTDNCGMPSLALSQNTFSCTDAGLVVPVTLTVTDGAGNVDDCVCNVSVIDDVDPTLAFLPSPTVNVDTLGAHTLIGTDVADMLTATDDCTLFPDLVWTFVPAVVDCDDIGTPVSVLATVTDANNNSVSATVMVTVADNIAPVALCKAEVEIAIDSGGDAILTTMMVDSSSTDNCSGTMDFSLSHPLFACGDVGTVTTVTLTVKDNMGSMTANSDMCTTEVTVIDTIPPTVIPEDITISSGSNITGTSIVPGDVTTNISDNCSVISAHLSQSTFGCADVGTNNITLTVTDVNGNATVVTMNVTVEDDVAPTAIAQNIQVYLDADGLVTPSPFLANMGSNDLCDNSLNFSITPATYTCADLGAFVPAMLEVTDDALNSDSAPFFVTVLDTIAPALTCQPYTAIIDATGTVVVDAAEFVSTASDNCILQNTLISLVQAGPYAAIQTFDCLDASASPIDIWVMVSDGSLNTDTCMTTLTLAAATLPIAMAIDTTIYLDATGGMIAINHTEIDNGSTGLCGVAVSLSQTDFDCDDKFAPVAVTLTATDAFGNTSTAISNVTVLDTIAPILTVGDINGNFSVDGTYTLTISDMATFTDNCLKGNVVASKTSFTCADVGTNVITFTATDESGNTAVNTATLTLSDASGPSFTCKSTIEVNLDPATSQYTFGDLGGSSCTTSNIRVAGTTTYVDHADLFDVAPTDNCGSSCDLEVAFSQTSFTCMDFGGAPISVLLTVTDAAGNSTVCTANVIVKNTAEAIVLAAEMIPAQLLDGTGSYTLLPSLINDGSTSACNSSSVILTVSPSTFNCDNIGTNTVILIAESSDGSIHEATTQIVIQEDINFPNSCTACPPIVLVNSNPILDGVYNAGDEILSNGKVVGSVVDFNANNTIKLNAGFSVDKAANFTAQIKECID